MKFDKSLNLNKIENKKNRKYIKRVLKKFSLEDCFQIGSVINAICIAVKFDEVLNGVSNEKI